MVTDDEREAIKRMRGSGHTHQEIADALSLKRTTVAYQLSKLKDTEEDNSIKVIQVSSFEPKETVIGFDEYSFESHRVNSTLYAAGSDIYEMRGGVIHHTSLRTPFNGHDYPSLAPIFRKLGQGWYRKEVDEIPPQLVGLQKSFFKDAFGRINTFCEKYKFDLHSFNDYISTEYYGAIEGLPHLPQFIAKKDIKKFLRKLSTRSPRNDRPWMKEDNYPSRLGIGTKEKVELLRYIVDTDFTTNMLRERFSAGISNLNKLFEIKDYSHPPTKNQWGQYEQRPHHLEEFGIPIPMAEYYKSRGIEEEDVIKVRKEGIETAEELRKIRESGAGSKSSYDEMQKHGINFKTFEVYKECRSIAYSLISPPNLDNMNQHERMRYFNGIRNSLKSGGRKGIGKILQVGVQPSGKQWDGGEGIFLRQSKLPLARKIGSQRIWNGKKIRLEPQEIFDDNFIQLADQMEELNLEWTRKNYDWLKSQDSSSIKHIAKFPSPRAARLFDTISLSVTHHMLLESLLNSYRRESSSPGPDIGDAKGIHLLLQKKPFTEICVSNLEGGFVERFEHGKPFLDTSKFKDLNTNVSELNTEIVSAINRNSLKDTLTKAWTRFEASSKELWARDLEEPLPTNGQVAVRMVDEMAKLVKFTPAMTKDLHLARQLRNDVIHGDEPREEIKPKHVRRVLEATEKIIKKLIG
jgi:hypothetical protein